MAALLPQNQPYLHRTMNVGQWEEGVRKYRETLQDVTVWEDAEYLFQVVGKNGEPYCRCFWKLRNQELYCHPAICEVPELAFRQT